MLRRGPRYLRATDTGGFTRSSRHRSGNVAGKDACAPAKKGRAATRCPAGERVWVTDVLEVQLEPELELPRVEGGCRQAEILAAAPLTERVDGRIKRVRGSLVKSIEEIKALGDQIEA